MAHKSKKKHIKHTHQHEAATATKEASAQPGTGAAEKAEAQEKRGIVRSIAKAARTRIAAKRKKIVERATSRVKSRVKSLFGRE